MTQIKSYTNVLHVIKEIISDSSKDFIKRSELAPISSREFIANKSYNNSDHNGMDFVVVRKLYMVHDGLKFNKDDPKKILFRRIPSHTSYKLSSKIFSGNVINEFQSTIFGLTDTKYSMILSDTSFDMLHDLIRSDSTVSCILNEERGVDKMITFRVRGSSRFVDKDKKISSQSGPNSSQAKDSEMFENVLLKLISQVTEKKQDCDHSVLYTFSILKVKDLLFGLLLPRLYCASRDIVNVWPIVPVSSVYNLESFVKSLKICDRSRRILTNVGRSVDITESYRVLNLEQELKRGITFPDMIRNKITLHQIYMAYIQEILVENCHFSYASVVPNSASYVKCTHCKMIYDHIFGFLRHWLEIRGKMLFRCHICNQRVKSITALGNHYHDCHGEWEYCTFKEAQSQKALGDLIDRNKLEKRKVNNFLEDYKAKKRKEHDSQKSEKLSISTKRNTKSNIFSNEMKKYKKELNFVMNENVTQKSKKKVNVVPDNSAILTL